AVQIPNGDRLVADDAAAGVELVELPVTDLPPDLGDVLRVLAEAQRRLRDRLAVAGVRVDEDRLRVRFADLLRQLIALAPARPVVRRLVLRQRDDRVDVAVLRIGRRRVRVLVVAYERAPDLLRFLDARRVVQRVAEVIVDAGELLVLRELLDDALVERDGRFEADREIVLRVVGARALFVERGEAVHRVGRRLRLARVARDEIFEALDRRLARLAKLLFFGRDLFVEAAEDRLLLLLVMELDDRRDRV